MVVRKPFGAVCPVSPQFRVRLVLLDASHTRSRIFLASLGPYKLFKIVLTNHWNRDEMICLHLLASISRGACEGDQPYEITQQGGCVYTQTQTQRCFASPNFPTLDYANSGQCGIRLCYDTDYTINAFSVERGEDQCFHDSLAINNALYCGYMDTPSDMDDEWPDPYDPPGTQSLPALTGSVLAQQAVSFSSDATTTQRGFQICFDIVRSPTAHPTQTPSSLPSSRPTTRPTVKIQAVYPKAQPEPEPRPTSRPTQIGDEIIVVGVTSKTVDHPWFNNGSDLTYSLTRTNGTSQQAPVLTLKRNTLYVFDQTHSSNGDHPLGFYRDADKKDELEPSYTVNGLGTGRVGIMVECSDTIDTYWYQCMNHNYMGNKIQFDPCVKEPSSSPSFPTRLPTPPPTKSEDESNDESTWIILGSILGVVAVIVIIVLIVKCRNSDYRPINASSSGFKIGSLYF